MPAKAGIQGHAPQRRAGDSWIPAFAGMTTKEVPLATAPALALVVPALEAALVGDVARQMSHDSDQPLDLGHGRLRFVRAG
jgi:hypothetical protein